MQNALYPEGWFMKKKTVQGAEKFMNEKENYA